MSILKTRFLDSSSRRGGDVFPSESVVSTHLEVVVVPSHLKMVAILILVASVSSHLEIMVVLYHFFSALWVIIEIVLSYLKVVELSDLKVVAILMMLVVLSSS